MTPMSYIQLHLGIGLLYPLHGISDAGWLEIVIESCPGSPNSAKRSMTTPNAKLSKSGRR